MCYALIVRGRQTVRELHRQLNRFAAGNSLRRNPLAKRIPFDQFGHDVMNIVRNTDVVYRNDVGMIQSCYRAGFQFEAAQSIGIRGERFLQDFQCHVTAKPRVVRAIHFAHSTCANQRNDFVRSELGVGSEGHGRPRLSLTTSGCAMRREISASLRSEWKMRGTPVSSVLAHGLWPNRSPGWRSTNA